MRIEQNYLEMHASQCLHLEYSSGVTLLDTSNWWISTGRENADWQIYLQLWGIQNSLFIETGHIEITSCINSLYSTCSWTMLIVLPNERNGLENWQTMISQQNGLDYMLQHLHQIINIDYHSWNSNLVTLRTWMSQH